MGTDISEGNNIKQSEELKRFIIECTSNSRDHFFITEVEVVRRNYQRLTSNLVQHSKGGSMVASDPWGHPTPHVGSTVSMLADVHYPRLGKP